MSIRCLRVKVGGSILLHCMYLLVQYYVCILVLIQSCSCRPGRTLLSKSCAGQKRGRMV